MLQLALNRKKEKKIETIVGLTTRKSEAPSLSGAHREPILLLQPSILIDFTIFSEKSNAFVAYFGLKFYRKIIIAKYISHPKSCALRYLPSLSFSC